MGPEARHRASATPRMALFRLAREIDPEPEHCFQVRKNAERLFAALAPLHGLGGREWALLEAAALLHDIGHRRGFQKHHKHSRDMILERQWPGLTARGRLIVACAARYHRKSGPKPGHRYFCELSEKDQGLVRALSAILRIADGLDRAHRASVAAIRAEIGVNAVSLYVTQRVESPEDIAGGLRKADQFEEVFGRRLCIAAGAPRSGIPV